MSLRYKESAIQPGGRLSYGHYLSSGNITNSVVRTSYYGDGTTNTIGGGNGGEQVDDTTSFYMFLSKESESYNAQQIAVTSGITDEIGVIGYRMSNPAATFVMDFSACTPVYDSSGAATAVTFPENYGILGLPTSGMSVSVRDNGTSATTIVLTVTSGLPMGVTSGELTIPANIYLSTANMLAEGETVTEDELWTKWYNRKDSCRRVDFKFTWKLEGGDAASVYTLDLSNEVASVNCDSGGTVLPGAVVLPECDATLFYGTAEVSGASFSININAQYHATGVGIAPVPNTNKYRVTFGSNFQFSGNTTPLAIEVIASYQGTYSKKTMTVYKNLAGADGTLPVARWLVPSANQIVYDPNSATTSPSSIRCACWKQVGGNPPEEDTETIIYWKYDGDNAWTSSEDEDPRQGIGNIDVSKNSLIFALMNASAEIYESETVPILKNGTNGTGSSPYRLDLSNQNASINCDSGGTILAGAIRPECTATLYYGENEASGVTYGITIPSRFRCTGVTIDSSTGVITFAAGNTLYWSGSPLQVTVKAYQGATLRGTAIMNVAKVLPGADGTPAVSYWLAPTANAIQVTSGGTASPSTISCKAWKQEGENAPVQLATSQTPYIYWGYNTDDPSARYSGQTIPVDPTKNFICFQLWNNSVQYDIETIPIVKDGQDGASAPGRQGPAIRGPVDWYSGVTGNRRFCNGEGPLESDKKFIDILLKDGNYYVCNTSYDGSPYDSWSSVSSAWTQSDASYNFVATEVLLANNGKIKFFTGNEIYLMDSGGTLSGGARAATDDDRVVFWAGSSEPGNGNFQVDFEGNIYAKSGTFAGYIQMPYSFVSELSTGRTNLTAIGLHSSSFTYYADERAYLISDSANTMDGGYSVGGYFSALMLPQPRAAINGMMYEVIVEPAYGISGIASMIAVVMSGNTYTTKSARSSNKKFQTLAFAEKYEGDNLFLYGGRYQFTCIPHRSSNLSKTYTWAITMANGQFLLDRYVNSSTSKQYLLTPVFSYDEHYNEGLPYSANTINKLIQYSGTKPTIEQNSHQTLYVSRD